MPEEAENVTIPDGFEDEEYLGPHEREDLVEDVTSALRDISFDVEVNCSSAIETEIAPQGEESDDSESESSSEIECSTAILHKRVRKPNSFVGEVKKGKYSR